MFDGSAGEEESATFELSSFPNPVITFEIPCGSVVDVDFSAADSGSARLFASAKARRYALELMT